MLVNDLKAENSTKRMIDILLNQQNNPLLKYILSEFQMTIKKLPHNENSKDDINNNYNNNTNNNTNNSVNDNSNNNVNNNNNDIYI